MLVRVTKADSVAPLVRELVMAPTCQAVGLARVLAGDPGCVAWFGEFSDVGVLDEESAASLARYLDLPRRLFGERRRNLFMHVALFVEADDGPVPEHLWAGMAQHFMESMDVAEGDGGGSRWVALTHGLSVGGRDHVHLVASLVREDGTRVGQWQDYRRAQSITRELEHVLEIAAERDAP